MTAEQLLGIYRPAKAGTAFPYHFERFNTRATHIQCCPRQPRDFLADSAALSALPKRVRNATASLLLRDVF
jgi:hypothetical protein